MVTSGHDDAAPGSRIIGGGTLDDGRPRYTLQVPSQPEADPDSEYMDEISSIKSSSSARYGFGVLVLTLNFFAA